jgi:hypothetical protein
MSPNRIQKYDLTQSGLPGSSTCLRNISFNNVNVIAPQQVEPEVREEPTTHGEDQALGNLKPIPATFSAIELNPMSNSNLGDLSSMSILDYTHTVNGLIGTLCTALIYQLSLETLFRRMMIHTTSKIALVNFNLIKTILPAKVTEELKPYYKGAPTKSAQEHLHRFIVAALQSQSQIFAIHNIMKFKFRIVHSDKQPADWERKNPLWFRLGEDANIDMPQTTINVSPADTLGQVMKKLKYNAQEMSDLKTSFLILFHIREMDPALNLFTENMMGPEPELSNKAPTGRQSSVIPVTEFFGILIQTPNVMSVRQNLTMYTGMDPTKWNLQFNKVMAVTGKFLIQPGFRSKDEGTYPTEFAAQTIYKTFNTLLDSTISLVPILYVELALGSTTWRELYDKDFTPTPTRYFRAPQRKPKYRDEIIPPPGPLPLTRTLEVYKGTIANATFAYTATELMRTRIITILRPGPYTTQERLLNLQKVGPRLEQHHLLNTLVKEQELMKEHFKFMKEQLRTLTATMMKIVSLPHVEIAATPKADVQVVDLIGAEEGAAIGYDPQHPDAPTNKQAPLAQPDPTPDPPVYGQLRGQVPINAIRMGIEDTLSPPPTPTMSAEYNEIPHKNDDSKDTGSPDYDDEME